MHGSECYGTLSHLHHNGPTGVLKPRPGQWVSEWASEERDSPVACCSLIYLILGFDLNLWQQSSREEGIWFRSLSEGLSHEAQTKNKTPWTHACPQSGQDVRRFVSVIFSEHWGARNRLLKKKGARIPTYGRERAGRREGGGGVGAPLLLRDQITRGPRGGSRDRVLVPVAQDMCPPHGAALGSCTSDGVTDWYNISYRRYFPLFPFLQCHKVSNNTFSS